MSRTHLYRGARSARPLLAIITASAWSGAAILGIAAAMPALASDAGASTVAPDGRFALILAASGVAVGLLVLVRELVAGPTTLRGVRLAGASVLAVAAGAGALDVSRDSVRPGPAVGDLNAAEVTAREAGEAAPLARRRLAWSAAGLVGALIVVAGGTASLRTRAAGA
jgi:hypothetical protein